MQLAPQFRHNVEKIEEMRKKAKEQGKSVSQYIRDAIDSYNPQINYTELFVLLQNHLENEKLRVQNG